MAVMMPSQTIFVISLLCCPETPNVQAHRERPNRGLSDSAEPQRGRDAVARVVSYSSCPAPEPFLTRKRVRGK